MRVVIGDDAALFREGVARILGTAGFTLVGMAADADELVLLVAETTPDVAIIDVRMPPTNTDDGLRAALLIRDTHPDVGVLMLSQYADSDLAVTLLAGARRGVGYLLKDSIADVTELTDAVRRVGNGGSVVDPAVVARLVGRHRPNNAVDGLSDVSGPCSRSWPKDAPMPPLRRGYSSASEQSNPMCTTSSAGSASKIPRTITDECSRWSRTCAFRTTAGMPGC